MLPTPEMMKGNIHESTSSTKHEDVEEGREGHRRKQFPPWERVLLAAEEKVETSSTYVVPLPEPSPTWVEKFRKWLPEFLREVSKRLSEGEWYPLSSLKGDFRATCSMELGYSFLGYFKLSDFIRSMQGLCRMKIVPVGRGPATHVVLLESLPKSGVHHSISTAPQPQRGVIGSSSFVNKGRSYAVAASSSTQYGQSMSTFTPRATVPTQEDFFLNFLEEGSSFFTPWSQQKPLYSIEPPPWKPILSRQLWENSPQSVLSPYSPQESLFQNSPTTKSSFEITESSKISHTELPNCVLCKERKAIWVAVPCAHRALCTPCRATLKFSQKIFNCFSCGQPVGKFIAFH